MVLFLEITEVISLDMILIENGINSTINNYTLKLHAFAPTLLSYSDLIKLNALLIYMATVKSKVFII